MTSHKKLLGKNAKDKLGEDAVWLPLKIFGTISVNLNGDVSTRISGEKKYFRIDEYKNSPKRTLRAANKYLIEMSACKRVNLFTVVLDRIYVDISPNNDGTIMLIIDEDKLDLIRNKLWVERYGRAQTFSNGKRIYVEELLFHGKHIRKYKDGNKLNNTRKIIKLSRN